MKLFKKPDKIATVIIDPKSSISVYKGNRQVACRVAAIAIVA